MPRDSNGNYTLPAGNPVISGTTITSSWGNQTLTDIGTVLTASLDRSGNGGMLAPFKIVDGVAGAPGLAFAAEPATGLFRLGGNSVGLSIGGALSYTFTPTTLVLSGQRVTMNSPGSGTTLTIIGANVGPTAPPLMIQTNSGGFTLVSSDGANTEAFIGFGGVSHEVQIGSVGNFGIALVTSNTERVTVSSSGTVNINPPTTGSTLVLGSSSIGNPTLAVSVAPSGVTVQVGASAAVFGIAITSSGSQTLGLAVQSSTKQYNLMIGNSVPNAFSIADGGSDRLRILNSGQVSINPPSAGNAALLVNAVAGTHSTQIADSDGTAFNAGFLESPVVVPVGARTTILSDSGKAISPSTAATQTIAANSSVPYPIGTKLTFYNQNGGAYSIALNADVLGWVGNAGVTGTRSIAPAGKATVQKMSATVWLLDGTGIT